jgi:hypothetical protein
LLAARRSLIVTPPRHFASVNVGLVLGNGNGSGSADSDKSATDFFVTHIVVALPAEGTSMHAHRLRSLAVYASDRSLEDEPQLTVQNANRWVARAGLEFGRPVRRHLAFPTQARDFINLFALPLSLFLRVFHPFLPSPRTSFDLFQARASSSAAADARPVLVTDLGDRLYAELALPRPTRARHLTLKLNPGNLYVSAQQIAARCIAVVGFAERPPAAQDQAAANANASATKAATRVPSTKLADTLGPRALAAYLDLV